MIREYAFSQNFEDSYKEKWAETVQLVAENRFNGEKLFYNHKNFFLKACLWIIQALMKFINLLKYGGRV